MSLKKNCGKTARLAAAAAGLGWFLLYLGVLLGTLYAVGTDAQLYYRLQTHAGVQEQAPITSEELRQADEALAECLRGNADALESTPFSEDERTHMQDCLHLFRLLKTAVFAALAAGIALLVLSMGALKYRGLAAGRIAALCLWIPILGAVIWALADFYGLFVVFHQLLFTNDLWLMDPAKDLMIRICPESMFETMAAIIAAVTLIFTLIADRAVRFALGRNRRR